MGSSGAITGAVSPVNLTTVAAGVMLANKLAAGDANPAFEILGDGTMEWGPGGGTAPDLIIYRNGAGQLSVRSPAQGGQGLGLIQTGGAAFSIGPSQGNQLNLMGDVRSFASGAVQVDSNIAQVRIGSADLRLDTAGKGIRITEGANARMGVATLVAGTVTVANTSVTANTRIFLTNDTPGGAPGFLRVSATVVGTSFTILSSSGTDTSTIAWLLLEPG